MGKNTICLQTGLQDLKVYLEAQGFDVVEENEGKNDYRFVVVDHIGAYEEMEPVSYIKTGKFESIVIDSSKMSKEDLVKVIEKNLH